jgi:hypothetical protein
VSVTSRTVEAKAPKGGHLTLGDLKGFAATLEQAGAADTTSIDGSVTFGGHLKALKASAVRFGDKQ